MAFRLPPFIIVVLCTQKSVDLVLLTHNTRS